MFLYLISFLLFPCTSVWEHTRAIPISYSHTERFLIFFARRNSRCFGEIILSKSNHTTTHRHGGVSGSPLACGACKSCPRPGFESRVKRASQFKMSQTAVSTTERHFTLSVVCLIVECTKDIVRVIKKYHSDSCSPAWLEMDRKVCPTTTTS